MKREEALKFLGLEHGVPKLTPEIVAEAFRSKAKQCHPDTSSQQESPGESHLTHLTMDVLTMARKVVLESLDGTDLCCRLCSGLGMVHSGMGYRKCVACKGTGERR